MSLGFYSDAGHNKLMEEDYEQKDKNLLSLKNKKSISHDAFILSKENTETVYSSLPTSENLNIDFKNIFGELIDEQAERIKKFSPFGSFKTWKICKIIGTRLNIYLIDINFI